VRIFKADVIIVGWKVGMSTGISGGVLIEQPSVVRDWRLETGDWSRQRTAQS
jgi:hypothetical protein